MTLAEKQQQLYDQMPSLYAAGYLAGAANGGDVLIVTLDRSSTDIMTASHTSDQIYKHVMSGGTVMLETYPGNYKMLVNNNPSISIFEYSNSVSDGKICESYIEIDMYGTAIEFTRYVPTIEKLTELEDTIGDIETALDAIIAIQNELIGGDGE